MTKSKLIPTHNAGRSRIVDTEMREELPNAIDLEVAILGALMLDRNAYWQIADLIFERSFFLSKHQTIFKAIHRLQQQQQPVDMLTVVDELKKCGELDFVGGAVYLVELTNRVASAANIEYHARIIQQKFILRQIIAAGQIMVSGGREAAADCFDVLQQAEGLLLSIVQTSLSKAVVPVADVAMTVFRLIEKNALKVRSGDAITGISSGMDKVDELTGGWQKSDLLVIAARPGIGKTGFALSIALHAVQCGIPVAFFSLEMSNAQLVMRILAMMAQVSVHKMRDGRLDDAHLFSILRSADGLSHLPLFLDETPALTIGEMRAKCRRLKSQKGIELIIVDYLQLLQTDGSKSQNREQEVATISRALKSLAKELDVPLIALAQLSRAVESRGGSKRPQLSDLRDSGALEQDADLVAFIYRAEYYGILEDENGNSLVGKADLIFAKNRHGATDTITLQFEKAYTHFSSLIDSEFLNASTVANAESMIHNAENTPAFSPASPHLYADRNDQDIPF